MKPRVLQIFSRYLASGGEERVTQLIETALADDYQIDSFFGSTERMLGASPLQKITAPLRAMHNFEAAHDLEQLQKNNRYSLWLIHNVLPGLSPSVYATAFNHGVPVVHYLHNFRMMCTNGFLLNHGKPCTRCISGNYWPAFLSACWRNSRAASGMMGLIIGRIRALRTFRKVTAWVALNEQQKRMHVQIGIPADRIHVVPNFVEHIANPSAPNPNGDVLFLGRLSQEKGIDHLLRAWAGVHAANRRLLIAGSGPQSDSLRALARDLALPNVEFLGPVPREKHAALWARTAFSVIPSLWNEPFPMSMLESWSNMRAVVAPRLGCFGETIRHGTDGLLYEPYSVEALMQTLQRALDDASHVETMGRLGRQRIESEFSHTRWVERITQIVQSALAVPS